MSGIARERNWFAWRRARSLVFSLSLSSQCGAEEGRSVVERGGGMYSKRVAVIEGNFIILRHYPRYCNAIKLDTLRTPPWNGRDILEYPKLPACRDNGLRLPSPQLEQRFQLFPHPVANLKFLFLFFILFSNDVSLSLLSEIPAKFFRRNFFV